MRATAVSLFVLALLAFPVALRADTLEEAYRLEGIGEYDKALALDRKLAAEEKPPAKATVQLARLLRLLGKDDDAAKLLAEARPAAQDKSVGSDLAVEAGELAVDAGRWEEAGAAFEAALKLVPGGIEARTDLGLLELGMGKEKEALARWMKLFDEYDPNARQYSSRELRYLGTAFKELALRSGEVARTGTLQTVVNDILLRGAVKADPTNHMARWVRGEILVSAFQTPDAKKTFDDGLKLNPHHPWLRAGLGLTLAQNYGTLKEAPEQLNKALATNPRLAVAHLALAHLYLHDELYDQAKRHLDAALAVNPKNLEALSILAGYHLLRDEKAPYEALEKRVLAIHPRYGSFYYTVAAVIEAKRQFEGGVKLCKKAVELDPKLWHAWIALGSNLLRVGMEEEAKKVLEVVRKEFNFHVQSRNFRVLLESYNEYTVQKSANFTIRLHVQENAVMRPLVTEFMERAYRVLTRRYGFVPEGPLLFEMFKEHNDFAVRTLGLPGLGALGACFGKVVTMDSPRAFGKPFNWAATAWHEFAHVITLQQSGMRVPRWFTEGLSEYEEHVANPSWQRPLHVQLHAAWTRGELRSIEDLNAGFTRPRYPEEVVVCYFHAGLLCQWMAETFGFARIPAMLKLYAQGKKTPEVIRDGLGLSVKEFDAQSLAWLKKQVFDRVHVLPSYSQAKLEDLKDQLEEKPDDLALREELALAYLARGMVSDAEMRAGEVVSRNPKAARAHLVLGRIHASRASQAKAKEHLEAALKAGARDYHARMILAGIYQGVDKNDEMAVESWKKAKDELPFAGAPFLALAGYYKKKGDQAAWAAELEGVVARDGTDVKQRLELGNYYWEKADHGKVTKYLGEAIEIDPFQVEAQVRLGQSLVAQQRFEEALLPLRIAVQLKPKEGMHRIYTAMAEAYLGLKDKDKARVFAREALAIKPGYARAQRLLEQLDK